MQGYYMDTVWHDAPDSKNVPLKGDGATVLNPMSKNIASDPLGLFWNPFWAPLRVLLYPLGFLWAILLWSFGILWTPLELLRGSFGILWGSLWGFFWGPLGVLWGVLWSSGIP